MIRCRSCNAPLRFAINPDTGKKMPLDYDPTPAGTIRITNGYGVVVTASEILDNPSERRYLSHFALCPAADQWRGKRR